MKFRFESTLLVHHNSIAAFIAWGFPGGYQRNRVCSSEFQSQLSILILAPEGELFQLQIWHDSHVIPAWYLRSYQYLTNVTSWHVSNGPRFTNASYHGLTADGAVKVKREVSTWATRDVARHLHSFRYEVLRMLRVGQDGSEALANVMGRCQWIRDILAILMRIPMGVSLPDDLPMESEYLGALPVGGHLRSHLVFFLTVATLLQIHLAGTWPIPDLHSTSWARIGTILWQILT